MDWLKGPQLAEFQSTRPRGARLLLPLPFSLLILFQSTRPRGARQGPSLQDRDHPGFQSTRPRGARPDRVQQPRVLPRVSIHAPARGATQRAESDRQGPPSFNPRARAGRDNQRTTEEQSLIPFQSTRPRGARHQGLRLVVQRVEVSIHAPARGATVLLLRADEPLPVSIHAPARGATSWRW